ncbi:hypothetical protein EVG20_g5476 [Dentipellis fragilis]|uniref:Zn(2)-C6 fungal-type domain-containing protein n=1 Tax=Dentipellis fragilis TaxID=205917 RepID=A0A4Y9YV46_9AGAM|nr:hypothetical protein EVG20_g5476 [Dentipellis fragilis]
MPRLRMALGTQESISSTRLAAHLFSNFLASSRMSTSKRGTYTRRACNYCRRRKIKCDGQVPVCASCKGAGRECTWDSEHDRKPPSPQYVETLEKRVKSLEDLVRSLRGDLQLVDPVFHDRAMSHSSSSDSFSFRGSESAPSSPVFGLDMVKTEEHHAMERLCAPTERLHLENERLQFYGPTSLFRLGRQASHDRTYSGEDSDDLFSDPPALDGHSPPELDWARHLPANAPLSRAEHDGLLDCFFRFFTSWRMCIIPAFFLRDMHRYLSVPRGETPPRTSHYSPMLHNSIVALAAAFSDHPELKHIDMRRKFAAKAKDDLEKECSQPSLSAVVALSFLATFHSSQGEHELGYMYFGMSTRMSHTFGVHIDCSAWVTEGLCTETQMWDRNWLYWNMTTLDVFWSLFVVGRDFCLPEANDRSPDFNFHDSSTWDMPRSGPPRDTEDPNSGLYTSVFIATCNLLQIGRRVIGAVNKLSERRMSHESINDLLTNMEVQLLSWKENLSEEIDIKAGSHSSVKASPPRLMMQMAYYSLMVVLHRPFCLYSERKDRVEHLKVCNKNAANTLSLAKTWRTLYSLRYVPMSLVQVLSCAGTIFVLSAIHAACKVRSAPAALQASMDQAHTCIQYLLEIGESWECSKTMAHILDNLLDDQVKRRLNARTNDLNPPAPGSYINFQIQVPAPSDGYSGRAQPSLPPSSEYGSGDMQQAAHILPQVPAGFAVAAPYGSPAMFGGFAPGPSDLAASAQFFSIQDLSAMQSDFPTLGPDVSASWTNASNEVFGPVQYQESESYFPPEDIPMPDSSNYAYSSMDPAVWDQYR